MMNHSFLMLSAHVYLHTLGCAWYLDANTLKWTLLPFLPQSCVCLNLALLWKRTTHSPQPPAIALGTEVGTFPTNGWTVTSRSAPHGGRTKVSPFFGASDCFNFWAGGEGGQVFLDKRKVYLTWTCYIWYTFCCHSWKVSAKSQIRLVTFIPFLWRYLEFLILVILHLFPTVNLCFFFSENRWVDPVGNAVTISTALKKGLGKNKKKYQKAKVWRGWHHRIAAQPQKLPIFCLKKRDLLSCFTLKKILPPESLKVILNHIHIHIPAALTAGLSWAGSGQFFITSRSWVLNWWSSWLLKIRFMATKDIQSFRIMQFLQFHMRHVAV